VSQTETERVPSLANNDVMTSQPTDPSSPEVLRTLESLSGVEDVRPFANGYSVEFPEVDFVIRLSDPGADPACDTQWEVTVREPLPGLNTWWGTWNRSFSVHRADAGPHIAEEVRHSLSRVRSMLDDHARGVREA
jgi:hypothetical protein